MQSRRYRYRLVDVFAERPFEGNPVAVFTDARGLDAATMQMIARELNRAQTSFVFPAATPDGSPQVRVFTPNASLPCAEYPTIGAAFALWHSSEAPPAEVPDRRMVFERADGPVSVSGFARVLTVRQPIPKLGSLYRDVEAVMAILGLKATDRMQAAPVQVAAAGVPYLVVPIQHYSALGSIRWRQDIWERTIGRGDAPNVLAFTLETERAGSTARMRTFAPSLGVFEEPATEAACGPLAAYLVRYGFTATQSPQLLIFEQGAELGRPSHLHVAVEREGDDVTSVRVGGQCLCVGEGVLMVNVPDDAA